MKAGLNLIRQAAGVPRDLVQPLADDARARLAALLQELGAPMATP